MPVKPKAKKAATPPEDRPPDKLCPRCGEMRQIMPTRRTCGPCFRDIGRGGDRRIAEGLSPLGFWDHAPEERRSMWKTWVRTMVDMLQAPIVAAAMGVEVHTLREWYTAGHQMPPERLIAPTIEAVVYLSGVERAREPQGSATPPKAIRSVKLDSSAVEAFFKGKPKTPLLEQPNV